MMLWGFRAREFGRLSQGPALDTLETDRLTVSGVMVSARVT